MRGAEAIQRLKDLVISVPLLIEPQVLFENAINELLSSEQKNNERCSSAFSAETSRRKMKLKSDDVVDMKTFFESSFSAFLSFLQEPS